MKGLGGGGILGYCTNVHPTTSAQEVLQMIRTECLQVKTRIDPAVNFGIGLWLSSARLSEFQSPELLNSLKNECQNSGIQVFSWNAFPYLDFHQEVVKEKVYLPDWTEQSRVNYTLDLMDFTARLGLGTQEVSISTLPVAGKSLSLKDPALRLVVENLVEVILKSVEIEEAYGISVHLDLEPEPFCFLETSQDAVRFFKEYLLPGGSSRLENQLGISHTAAEELILNKIRICYDTCHAAVMFETPATVLGNYDKLGIRIGKVQISSGLVFRPDRRGETQSFSLHQLSESYKVLKELSLDRYLHQVVGKDSKDRMEFHPDLKYALLAWEKNSTIPMDEYRIHYHVPVFMERLTALNTTQHHILELLDLARTREITNHWEVETYTWSVLPSFYRKGNLPELIAQEINWVNEMSQRDLP